MNVCDVMTSKCIVYPHSLTFKQRVKFTRATLYWVLVFIYDLSWIVQQVELLYLQVVK